MEEVKAKLNALKDVKVDSNHVVKEVEEEIIEE